MTTNLEQRQIIPTYIVSLHESAHLELCLHILLIIERSPKAVKGPLLNNEAKDALIFRREFCVHSAGLLLPFGSAYIDIVELADCSMALLCRHALGRSHAPLSRSSGRSRGRMWQYRRKYVTPMADGPDRPWM
jgi:hypothetical protein